MADRGDAHDGTGIAPVLPDIDIDARGERAEHNGPDGHRARVRARSANRDGRARVRGTYPLVRLAYDRRAFAIERAAEQRIVGADGHVELLTGSKLPDDAAHLIGVGGH